MKYIAYGSNMSVGQMAYRCSDAKLIGTGYIEGARLEFYLHATVERSEIKTDRVPVAVWEIGAEDEQRLDLYEGYPSYYTKREWTVCMTDGSQIRGMIYLMLGCRPQPPESYYYEGIRAAYEDLGLASEIETALRPALVRTQKRVRRGGRPK